ncbi:hypothetical protein NHL50_03995 [Acidimicrobiia bacterium EGI L10123]|uniref:hypothetical protein n=1 Tax=Salinilacustrithrix flava TaxID=2957203 RepID=UPI003D7C1D2A|nr:hypothetical protein [Acidimicrobiia bacterium EGI L10123]
MRTVVRTVSWVLLFAALGAAGASWFTPTPRLDADDASDLALDALSGAEVDVERVEPPVRMVHETGEGDLVDAWRVLVDVRARGADEQVELRVQESAGQLVYVDDLIGDAGTERLLSDEQFEVLRQHRDDTLADRWVLRNALAAIAAIGIAATCYLLATRSDPIWSAR